MFKKTHFKNLPGSVLIGVMAVISSPAMATNEAMLDLLKILHDKGSITAKEYKLLVNTAKADGGKVAGTSNEINANVDKKTGNLAEINTNGKLEIKDSNGNKIRVGGRLQYDTTLVGTEGAYTGSSESQLRRARIYLSGTWAKDWGFKFQYDIEDTQDGDQAIEDAYIKYTGWPLQIRLGQGKNPYSMGGLTSSKYIAFIERSFVATLFNHAEIGVGNKNMGITATWDDMQKSGFLTEASYTVNRAAAGAERDLDDAHGLTGRLVWADYDKKVHQLLHAGISAGYRRYPNNAVGRIRVRPNVSEGDRILDTGDTLPADSYSSFNLNIAGMYDRFWADAEYFYGDFDLSERTTAGRGNTDMQGVILQGGVFLTAGDNRRYQKGAWNSVKVKNPVGKGGYGAWELALRYDRADIGAGIQTDNNTGEEAAAFSAALNWYPINNIRFQANYIKTLCDGGENERCDWDDTTTESNPDFFVLRAQTFF